MNLFRIFPNWNNQKTESEHFIKNSYKIVVVNKIYFRKVYVED